MPLFVAIRRLSSSWATWCGALWGGGIFLFASALSSEAIPNPDINAMALVAIPAAYAGLMALYSRRFGYSPLAMGLGWIVVEIIFQILGQSRGLLTGVLPRGLVLRLISCFLGYGFVAFAVSYVNAVVISITVALCDGVRVQPRLSDIQTTGHAFSMPIAINPHSKPLPAFGPRSPPAGWLILQ
jgi:hypothetical protein